MADQRLQTLLAVVREGSFTRAGRLLGLSQPTISYQIHQLEAEYVIKIFNRSNKQLNLTPEGEVLVKYARRMDGLNGSLLRELANIRQEARHFTVGITPTCGESMIGQVFSTYCTAHPQTSISLVTDSSANLCERLDDFTLDFAMVDGPVTVAHCTVELLGVDDLCVALSPQHPLSSHSSITLDELKKESLILRRGEAGTRRLFESALAARMETLRNFDVRLEMDNITSIKELVAANLGVTIISRGACREEMTRGTLRLLPISGMHMVREINIVCQNDFNHPETLAEIRRLYAAGN